MVREWEEKPPKKNSLEKEDFSRNKKDFKGT